VEDLEKKERILKAAMEEFSKKGFSGASTNEIAKEAGTAKGLIFHYFKDKENLYLETYKKAVNTLVEEFETFIAMSKEKNFFETLKEWSYKKLEFMAENPEVSDFMLTMLNLPKDMENQVLAEVKKIQSKSWAILFEKFQLLNLRKDLDPQIVFKFIIALFNGLGDMYLELYKGKPEKLKKDTEKIVKEADMILEILKHGILLD